MHKVTLFAVVLVALTTLACGGGGGSSSPAGPSTFSGIYNTFGMGGETGPIEVTALLGAINADGVSQFAGSLLINTNSVVATGIPNNFDYTVDGARNLDWQFGLSGTAYSGGVASDGSAALVGTVATGSSPAFQLLARPGASFTNASLNANYHSVMQSYSAPNFGSSVGHMSFTGGGALQRSVALTNTGGVVTTLGSWIGPGTYTVSPDGTFVADLGLGLTASGQIVPGSDVVLLAGSTTNGQLPLVMAMIRQTAGASDATFAGEYWSVALRSSAAGFDGEVATVTVDGAGNGSIVGRRNTGTTVLPFPARALGYTVASDGQLDLFDGAISYRGAVSADGRFAMLGGSTTSGAAPAFHFLMRK